MSGDDGTYGDTLDAVLIPPRRARFREVTGVGDAPLRADVGGWSKLAILAPDRVFLFPRDPSCVQEIEREAAVLELLESRGLPFVPRLLGRFEDRDVSPYPFIALSRVAGRNYATVEAGMSLPQISALLFQLGEVVARVHELPVELAAGVRRQEPFLDAVSLLPSQLEVARSQLLPESAVSVVDVWASAVGEVAAMRDVFLHGDVCENQLIVSAEEPAGMPRIEGLIDWGGACIGHLLADLDFGNWGRGIFAYEAQFGPLREALWESYRSGRSVELPDHRVVHLFFSLREARWCHSRAQEADADDWTRTRLPIAIANLAEATRALQD